MYEVQNARTYVIDDDGERRMLCNFEAEIAQETRYVDGAKTETVLTITGRCPNPDDGDPIEFPPVEVKAENFAGLQWVMPAWGVRAVIQPGGSVKEDLRTAIQLRSKPKTTTVYRHIGWTQIDKKPAYLHADGAIKATGNDPSVQVQLPQELSHYCLTCDMNNPHAAVQATLQLAMLAPPEITWPLMAGTFAPLFGPVDFAIHVTGRTGTFKSEFMSIWQSHYGAEMDARHLPGSWSSTANALEAQAYHAANAPFVVDDFVPTGTSWQMRSYQQNADKLIRSQGNQSGRARLTDTSNLQTAMYPRGILLSTGEDTPEGHSVRARMLIVELSPGDITARKLTQAQQNRHLYPQTTAHLIQYLCRNRVCIKDHAKEIRDSHLDVGHTRTPSMIGTLTASILAFLDFATHIGAINEMSRKGLDLQATDAILQAADQQASYLQDADPCDAFCQGFRHVLAAGLGHIRTVNGGIPRSPTLLGWTEETSLGDMPTFKSHGPCIGWISWTDDELYIEVNIGYNVIRKTAGPDMPLTKQTMMKRLKDSGLLTRTDDGRQRNSIRLTAEGHPRQVLALPVSTLLQTQEKPNGDD